MDDSLTSSDEEVGRRGRKSHSPRGSKQKNALKDQGKSNDEGKLPVEAPVTASGATPDSTSAVPVISDGDAVFNKVRWFGTLSFLNDLLYFFNENL